MAFCLADWIKPYSVIERLSAEGSLLVLKIGVAQQTIDSRVSGLQGGCVFEYLDSCFELFLCDPQFPDIYPCGCVVFS